MIKSKSDYLYYLEADRIAKGRAKRQALSGHVKAFLLPDPIWEFQVTLRKLEYFKNCKKSITSQIYLFFLKKKFNKLSLKLGFTTP